MDHNHSREIPVMRSSMPGYDEYCAEIRSIFESRWLTNMGEKHGELERKLRDYLAVPNITLLVNGHNALEYALEGLGLAGAGASADGGEVITTPFTFVSTANAIVRKGLTPVFCDIRRSDCTLDPELIEPLITERTRAIVPVHVYGIPCDVEAIRAIADKHSLKVVYDAAHAFGVTVDGVGIGSFGDASTFSFHATKVFHTIEGGAVTSGDAELCERLAKLRNFGITDEESAECIGGNAKMSEFAAAMGLCNLRHIDEEIARRGRVVARYRERLEGVPGLHLPMPRPGVKENFAFMPVVFDDAFGASRDEVFRRLSDAGIRTRKRFFPLVSDLESFRGLYDPGETPVAADIASRVLTLPLYADLELETVDAICERLSKNVTLGSDPAVTSRAM